MNRLLVMLFALLPAAPAAAGSLAADFNYMKVKFVGTARPIQIVTVYDYQQRTYIKVTDEDRPQPYNSGGGAVLGAYMCHNNTLIQVPLYVSGGYYVADGLFSSLFLYRRAQPRLVEAAAPPLAGLLSGIVRVDYQGRRAAALRVGRDDCMALLTDFFIALEKGGKAELPLGTLGHAQASDEIRAAMHETVRQRRRGAFRRPETQAVRRQPTPPMMRLSKIRVPYYVNRSRLGPRGTQIVAEALAEARLADEIYISVSPDSAAARQHWRQENPEAELQDAAELSRRRGEDLKQHLVAGGVMADKIKSRAAADVPRGSQYDQAADALLEFHRQVPALQPRRQVSGVEFVGEAYLDEQISVAVEPRLSAVLPAVPQVGAALPLPPPAAAPPLSVAAVAAGLVQHKNSIRGQKGQLLSDVLAAFLQRNGYQMVWQVTGGLDWRIDEEFELSGAYFNDTLTRLLGNFPLQAVLDENEHIVRIRLKASINAAAASNPLPRTEQEAAQ